jgi:hypothetical protein
MLFVVIFMGMFLLGFFYMYGEYLNLYLEGNVVFAVTGLSLEVVYVTD